MIFAVVLFTPLLVANLIGGGLCLGNILTTSGIADALGQALLEVKPSSYLLLGTMCVFLGIILSEFGSNTASAAIIIPIIRAS